MNGNYGKSALYLAVESQCFKKAHELIKNGAELDVACYSLKGGYTPLHIAVRYRNRSIVNLLLNSGANVNAINKYGETPLHCAVSISCEQNHGGKRKRFKEEDKHIIQMLLIKGADINATNEVRQTILHIAAQNGFAKLIEHLLHYDVDVNAVDISGNTAIHSTVCFSLDISYEDIRASGIQRRLITELLIYNEADFNAANYSGETALHKAAKSGCLQVVKLLLQCHIDVNVTDIKGDTPLHNAAYKCDDDRDLNYLPRIRKQIVEMLLDMGADVHVKNNKGETVLHIAASNGLLKVIKLLLEYNADVNALDHYKGTPLHHAVSFGHSTSGKQRKETVEVLIMKNANVNALNDNKESALYLAAKNGYEEVVEFLLQNGAIVDSKSQLLHIAAMGGHDGIIKLLLDAGTEINAVDFQGRTPLHLAVQKHNIHAIHMLLNYGADINLECNKKKTPFHFMQEPSCFNWWVSSYKLDYVFTCHVSKLKALNLYVSEKNLKVIYKGLHAYNYFYMRCEMEVIAMKNKSVNNTDITFFNILTKNINVLSKYAKNINIVNLLESDEVNILFPIYSNDIYNRLDQGLKRKDLIVKCSNCLYFLTTSTKLMCYHFENICDYLSNIDLRNVILAFNKS